MIIVTVAVIARSRQIASEPGVIICPQFGPFYARYVGTRMPDPAIIDCLPGPHYVCCSPREKAI
jgi:hypothetical protein